MKKIERLISIVMILLQKEIVSASEFSRLFDVSKRTIQRDIEALGYANIPIYAEHGAEGGYALMDEYKLDKRLVNSQDLENILVSLGGYDQLITNPEIQMTIQKIKSMTSLETTAKLDLSFYDWSGRSEIKEDITLINQAIGKNWLLTFEYVDQGGKRSCRVVEPYRLRLMEMHWYLFAYCLERKDYRTFKLTRMIDIKQEGSFSPRSDLESIKDQKHSGQSELVPVQLLVDVVVRDQFIERYGKSSVTEMTAESYLVKIELPESHFAYQFVAGFGNKVKILEPHSFIENYLIFLEETIRLYR
ncbi:YafY family protein [Planococcus liqunii]|uniref:YafY family protein n=1 Tax=Planococcus liqunii TaxID=3058394 RepID=A0ABT8MU87_9BACL|nr:MULTISPECIES: YafY family protein [unclassified Planococcus (in: firmicutes)]MDN7228295.1 YafY family protein [Planococcus sp. N064]WKA50805.1 YafY family protein [Planococcus sp. N056]